MALKLLVKVSNNTLFIFLYINLKKKKIYISLLPDKLLKPDLSNILIF
jgi:hypothetical protein